MTKKATKKKERSPAQKELDVIWDALSALYFNPVTKQEETRMGLLCKQLWEHKATANEIARRRQCLIVEWGSKTDTPESLVKHWQRYDEKKKRVSKVVWEHPIYTMVRRDNPKMFYEEKVIDEMIRKYESGETSMSNIRLAIRKWIPK